MVGGAIMSFWLMALAAGVFGVLLTLLIWLKIDPVRIEIVTNGDIILSLAIVGCSFMLLGGLFIISERPKGDH
jgi:glucan phosphoethanolaminetransferase (alkaline phosphatase superfamily)